jgi:hypothetical protein
MDLYRYSHTIADDDRFEKEFSEIARVDRNGIMFKDGHKIAFCDCINNWNGDEKYVAVRDISAEPPYMEFPSAVKPTRIIFPKRRRILLMWITNEDEFRNLRAKIEKYGYVTFDLS